MGEPRRIQATTNLRPYQQEAVDAIVATLADGGRGQVYAACGSGKTVIAMRAAEQLVPSDGIVVVLAPSLGLVAQTLANWQKHSSTSPRRFAVCSDRPDDEDGILTKDLPVLPQNVSTDPDIIAKWLVMEGPRLVAGTYLSADRLAAAVRATGSEIDLLICDEAHHLAGARDAQTRRSLADEELPARRRLFMTATPRIGRKTAKALSMDDGSVFGPVVYNYPFSRAIAEGHLEDYRIAVIGVKSSEAQALLTAEADLVDGVSMRSAAAQIALARAYRDFGMRRVISFHPRVDDAQRFVATLPTTLNRLSGETPVPTPTCLHANGRMGTEQRAKVLEHLADPPTGGWAVASNAQCLSEGIDVPAVDGVLFAHPKRSTVDVVQAVGRALRKHPDAPGPSHIIVPVITPDTGDDLDADRLDLNEFETLVWIIRSLREHDDALNAQLGKLSLGGVPEEGDEAESQLEERLKIGFHGLPEDLLADVRLVILRQVAGGWWNTYAHARDFHSEHGHLRIPKDVVAEDGTKLGVWIAGQRTRANQGLLEDDKRRALQAVGIEWTRKSHAERCRLLDAAAAFHAQHGDLAVPRGHVLAQDPHYKLGDALDKLRQMHQASEVDPALKASLDDLGMIWDSAELRWILSYRTAVEFQAEHGDLRVPTHWPGDLGIWLDRLRREDDRLGGQAGWSEEATSGQRQDLDRIGMVWAARKDNYYCALEAWYATWHRQARFSHPLTAEFRAFKKSLTELLDHLEQAHGTHGERSQWGFPAGEAARNAASKLDCHVACPLPGCTFVTLPSGNARQAVTHPDGCPTCGALRPAKVNADKWSEPQVAWLIDSWHLGSEVHSLYRCSACGHRWVRACRLSGTAESASIRIGTIQTALKLARGGAA